MVQIPRAVSTNQLTTQTTADPIRDIGTFTRTSQALQRAGQVLDNVATEFRGLQTLREVSKATIETNRQLGELEDEILSNPELTESSTSEFKKRSAEIIGGQLGSIKDERARLNAGLQFKGSALNRGFNIKREGRSADIRNAGTERQIITDQSLQDSLKVANEEQAMFIRTNLEILYNDNVGKGLMTQQQKTDDLVKFDEAVRKGKPQFDLDKMVQANGSVGAEQFIIDVQNGKYDEINGKPGLTTQEQQTLVNAATNRVEREKKIEKLQLEETQSKNLDELIPQVIDPGSGISNLDIEIMVLKGTLSKEDGLQVIKVLNGKKGVNAVLDPFVFNTIMNKKMGVIPKKDGSRFTTLDLQREVLLNLENLDPTTVKGLLAEFGKIEDKKNNDIKANAAARVKAYALENIIGGAGEFDAPGTKRGAALAIESSFYEQVLKEEATGERLYSIADTIIDAHKQKKDPSFNPADHKGMVTNEYFEGETILDPSSGEVKTFFIVGGEGRWITTTPAGKVSTGE